VRTFAWTITAAAVTAILGCHIGTKYSVGGTLTGLMGRGLVLQDNSGNDLGVTENGAFAFTQGVENDGAYSATVKTQPSDPTQTCTVHNGSGVIDKADVSNIIVSCTNAGRFAYVANQLSGDLSAYVIDPDGALTPIAGSPFAATGTAPASLAVDPNGRYLYVVNNASNDISVFAIDSATGALAATGLPNPTGSGPYAVAVDPRDRYLYVTNLASSNVSAFAIDAGTGLLTELGNSPFAVGAEPTSLKVDANGSFLYVANFKGASVTVFSIDPAGGSLSEIPGSPFAAGAGAISIALDPAGTFAYVANETAATVSEFSIAASGALTPVSGSPRAPFPWASCLIHPVISPTSRTTAPATYLHMPSMP
jgi:YVTN family beta-propeller protein